MSTKTNGFDLSAVKQIAEVEEQGTVVHIRDLEDRPMFYTASDGTEKPVTITVAGSHSRRHRKVEESIRARKFNPKKLTTEAFYEDSIEKVVACTLAWDGFFDDEVPIELTRHNAAQLYKAASWVLDQVTEAMQDHARFFSTSSPTPSPM